MRIVIDTNVLIAAFISHGACHELLEHCVINHEVVLSEFILSELKEKLTGKFHYTAREAHAMIDLLKSRCDMVETQKLPAPVSRDPDDDHVIATALAGVCDCIISGDEDLLELEKVGDIIMTSPTDFWKIEKG